jgi:hypothetical protein
MAATVEVRSVRVGARSTLYVSRDGALYRHYHDTDAWDGPLTPRVDAGGVSRCDGNRSLAAVVRCAFDEERFRGASEGDAPAHLLNALRCLVRSADVDELARRCGVARSTAWNYAARAVTRWPRAAGEAERLVHPPLLRELRRLPDRTGSLRSLSERLDAMRDDPDWRCLPDRFAHLRLARLCVEAEGRATAAVDG